MGAFIGVGGSEERHQKVLSRVQALIEPSFSGSAGFKTAFSQVRNWPILLYFQALAGIVWQKTFSPGAGMAPTPGEIGFVL
jgi:hypothetical protein